MRLEEVLELHATQEFAAHDAADQEAERVDQAVVAEIREAIDGIDFAHR